MHPWGILFFALALSSETKIKYCTGKDNFCAAFKGQRLTPSCYGY